MSIKKRVTFIFLILLSLVFIFACGNNKVSLNPKQPLTLTMWHNFGADMQKTMDGLVDEFNSTVGKEEGIMLNVTAISSSSELQEMLSMISNDDPGAPEMPDLTTAYPKTAISFQKQGRLANLDLYLTTEEQDHYVKSFIEEGRFGDGGLYVFPFAKSTEVLFLNKTLFDRFSKESGVGLDALNTFEGIAEASEKYYKWSNGKTFFNADSWVNLAQTGTYQLGEAFFNASDQIDFTTQSYQSIFKLCSKPAIMGAFASYNGYSSDLSKTGDVICSTGSSAGILFYGDTVTYSDNRIEPVEYEILPYPVFEKGEKVAIQRGNGFMVKKSSPEKEYAASVFLKWFTAPAQNMRFVSSTGYLPVTNDAFENDMPTEIEKVKDVRIKKMLTTVMDMYYNYRFYTPPLFESYDKISKDYDKHWKQYMLDQHEIFLKTQKIKTPEEYIQEFQALF